MHRLYFVGFLMMSLVACRSGVVSINATYERLSGVVIEDHVLFKQNVAGSVADIKYTPEGTYIVRLEIDNGFTNAATEYSRFHIIDDPHREGRKAIEIRLKQPGGKVLANGTTVTGVTPPEFLTGRLREDLEAGFGFIISQIEKFSRDIHKLPESDAYKALRESMEALAAEIQRAEKEARDKAKKEWLPKIERELDTLRKQLRQLGRDKELQPLEDRMEQIRKI